MSDDIGATGVRGGGGERRRGGGAEALGLSAG